MNEETTKIEANTDAAAPVDALVSRFDLEKKGGNYLGAAREFLQWNIKGGDSCTWGSQQPLTMTVKQIEEMAAAIAEAAINEDRKNIQQKICRMSSALESVKQWDTDGYQSRNTLYALPHDLRFKIQTALDG